MFKRYLLYCNLHFIALLNLLQAQNCSSAEILYYGEVDMKNGQTLRGEMNYSIKNNSLCILVDSIVKSYDISSIESFQVFDSGKKETKIFFSLPYQVETNFYRNFIFELLEQGKLTLFSRVVPTEEYRNMYYAGSYIWVKDIVLKENYFFLRDTEIVPFSADLKELLSFTEDKKNEIRIFLKENRLLLESREDIMKVVSYYNSFFPSH